MLGKSALNRLLITVAYQANELLMAAHNVLKVARERLAESEVE